MSTPTSNTELMRMTPDELRRDIALHRTEYAKMRMGVEMQKEKNHAMYKSKRREIARMLTALTTMKKKGVSAPAAPKKVVVAEKTTKKPSQAKGKSVKGVSSKSKKS